MGATYKKRQIHRHGNTYSTETRKAHALICSLAQREIRKAKLLVATKVSESHLESPILKKGNQPSERDQYRLLTYQGAEFEQEYQ